MIGRSGERGSGISVLAARHDDDDEMKKMSAKFELKKNIQPIFKKKKKCAFRLVGKNKRGIRQTIKDRHFI